MTMRSGKLWAIVVFFAGLLEVIGIRRKAKGDTLSEYTWSKTNHPLMAAGVTGLVGWLVYHFSFGRGESLGYWDLGSVLTGAVIGYLSRVRRRPKP